MGKDAVDAKAAGGVVPAGNHLGDVGGREMAKAGVAVGLRREGRIIDARFTHGHDRVHGRVVCIGARRGRRRGVVAFSSVIVGVDIVVARLAVGKRLEGPQQLVDGWILGVCLYSALAGGYVGIGTCKQNIRRDRGDSDRTHPC